MTDSSQRKDEVERLRRVVALARFWFDRFADPTSFVWNTPGKTPQDMARTALDDLATEGEAPEQGRQGAPVARVPFDVPQGTGKMERLDRERSGFVEFYQLKARQALNLGQVGAARAALRALRTSDFNNQRQVAEALFAVIRDSRSTKDEIADAARRIVSLPPNPVHSSRS